MSAGGFFSGLIGGLNQGITSQRLQNQRDAEREIAGEQSILTTLMQHGDDDTRSKAADALLRLHVSGKPTGFLGKLVGKRSDNPDIAALISGWHPKGSGPDSPVGTDGPAGISAPPQGQAPSAPLPSSPAGPAALPINTADSQSQISYGPMAEVPPEMPAPVAAPAPPAPPQQMSAPPAPAAVLPPPPGGAKYGLRSLEEEAGAHAYASTRGATEGRVAGLKGALNEEELVRALGGVSKANPSAALELQKTIQTLGPKVANNTATPEEAIQYSLAMQQAKLAVSPRDIELQNGRKELKSLSMPLDQRALQAKNSGDTEEYDRIMQVRKDIGLASRKPPTAVSAATDAEVATIMANPQIYSTLTPTKKAALFVPLAAAGFQNFGKELNDTAISKISESKSAIGGLKDLRQVLLDNEEFIGPAAGLQSLNPYSDARKAQAKIDLVKQRVGKALEGGVLRKEDEEKYKKILATLYDTPDTAIYKVDGVIESVTRDIEEFVNANRLAGRNVTGQSTALPSPPPSGQKRVYAKNRSTGAVEKYTDDGGKTWQTIKK